MVGLLGAYGAAGRVAAQRLAVLGLARLRLGGRDSARARALAERLAAQGAAQVEAVSVDLTDPEQLARFCAGCQVVINCAGPSYQVLGVVARAALAAGAHYVDAAGDRVAAADLLHDGARASRAVVFSAGLMPGLTALLPRLLVEPGQPPELLEVHAGGAVPLTRTSAADALLTRGSGFGVPFAVWRGGAVVPRALTPQRGIQLAGFDGPVDAMPFLTAEAAALGARLALPQLHCWNVYATSRLPDAFAMAWADGGDVAEHKTAVMQAAAADVAEREPYFVLHARAEHGPGPVRQLRLRTADPYGLTGAVAALTAAEVLRGAVVPGCHFAADVLNPRYIADVLAADPIVTELELTPQRRATCE